MRGKKENKNNIPVNIRFAPKTSDIRNFSQSIRSDAKTSEVATLITKQQEKKIVLTNKCQEVWVAPCLPVSLGATGPTTFQNWHGCLNFLKFLLVYLFLIFWQSGIPWCVAKCFTEGWWWYSETSDIAYFFVPFVRPCMHLNYGVISESHECRDCGWHKILVAEFYTTCPGERVLAATKFNVTFLLLRLCYVNTSTCFSKDAENLTTYGYVLWKLVCRCFMNIKNSRIIFDFWLP